MLCSCLGILGVLFFWITINKKAEWQNKMRGRELKTEVVYPKNYVNYVKITKNQFEYFKKNYPKENKKDNSSTHLAFNL